MNKREARNAYFNNVHKQAEMLGRDELNKAMRGLCLNDLFYLLTRAFKRADINNDWLFERCCEIQASPDGYLDLWAREHYKSTIITFGLTIQDILNDPEITVGIFSHVKPIAKGFLRQIKTELETNERLKFLFPEILYSNPKAAPLWSEDKGIRVKREGNPNAATVEAYGLVDGMPTSKHFSLLIYDDVVTRESVTTPEQIKKVTDSWALSDNLGSHGGKVRMIGTRYHFNDTYRTVMKREAAIPRIYPATDNGKVTGKPVFLSEEILEAKRRKMGQFIFACQMLQNPREGDTQGFSVADMCYYDREPDPFGFNFYILVDPANEKKKRSDYTSMFVLGLAPDRNHYVYEMVRDKLNLKERTDLLMSLHQQYLPLGVGYEHYGMQADIQHIEFLQDLRNYRFNITALGGSMSKPDRIRRLIPDFENHRFWFPRTHYRTDYEGTRVELVRSFVTEELEPFPVMLHDDMLDCLARIKDPDLTATFPKMAPRLKKASWRDRLKDRMKNRNSSDTSFMAG